VTIRDKANASHGRKASGVPLWSSSEVVNLADIPAGQQEFQAVPFIVLDPAENMHGSCIVLSRLKDYTPQISLPVNSKAASIYLLNAADRKGAAGLLITLHYADGTSHFEDVQAHSWSFPTDSKYDKAGPRTEDSYRVAWKKSTPDEQEIGVYVAGINNPHPEKEIAAVDFLCGGAQTRWLILGVTLSSAPVFFVPYDDLSTGIPDGWNGSVLNALIEGLAGVKDRGAAFSHTQLTPRWHAANVPSAEVTVRYPASAGYCSYKYQADERKLEIEFTGSAESFDVQLLLPSSRRAQRAQLDGHDIETTQRRIEDSSYLVLPPVQGGVHRVEIDLA
jgi:hypothetical protein